MNSLEWAFLESKTYNKRENRVSFNPERVLRKEIARRAHSLVSQSIHRGELVRAMVCEICDEDSKIFAHHADYNYPLDVIWTCYSCHRKMHKFCEVIYVV